MKQINKKKVLICINTIEGIIRFRQELVLKLIQNYRVIICALEDKQDSRVIYLMRQGIEYEQVKMLTRGKNPFIELRTISAYREVIKKHHPDIVLCYTIKPNIYMTNIASRNKIPVITNVTGLGSGVLSDKFSNSITNMYCKALNKSTNIFFQNEENRKYLINHCQSLRNKAKLINGSGVNLDKFKYHNLEEKKFLVVTFVGRLMREKGIVEYYEAAKNIKKKYPNIEFYAIGELDEAVKEMIKTNDVTYLGKKEDIQPYIIKSDIIVNPSYHEGMSNVLQEAAAIGRPLIATNIPGCKEIVVDGYNGFLCKVKSSESLISTLEKMIGLSYEQRKIMGQNSRQHVEENFNRKEIVEAYHSAIEIILGENINE